MISLCSTDVVGDIVAHILQTDKAALPLGKATSTSSSLINLARLPNQPHPLAHPSNLILHWVCDRVNEVPGTLSQIRQALKPEGQILASVLGEETQELL